MAYEPAFRVSRPRQLFPATPATGETGRSWDTDPSGQRFLLIREPQAAADDGSAVRPRIDIVVNWVEELKARVPVH